MLTMSLVIPVPIGTLVKYELTTMPSIINHYNIFRSIEINGSSAPGYSSGDALKALQEVAAQTLPEGFDYQFSGLSLQEMQSGSKNNSKFLLCVSYLCSYYWQRYTKVGRYRSPFCYLYH